MIALGIDPDLRTPAIAIVDDDLVVALEVLKVDRKEFPDQVSAVMENTRQLSNTIPRMYAKYLPDIFVVENQTIRMYGRSRPRDILVLGQVAGAALSACVLANPQGWLGDQKYFFPPPTRWKGSVPKEIHHKRILTRFKNLSRMLERHPRTLHTHLIDAVGLGGWGIRQFQKAL